MSRPSITAPQADAGQDARLGDDYTILSLSFSPWNHPYWTSRQFLMYELAQTNDVVYVNGRTYVRDLLGEKARSRKAAPPFPAPARMRVFDPGLGYAHVPGYPRLNRFLGRRFARRINRLARQAGRPVVAYVWDPLVVGLDELEYDRLIYHPYDHFASFSTSREVVERIVAAERKVVARADAVITPHGVLGKELGHPNTHVVPNGVFLPAFEGGAGGGDDPLAGIPRPRIGYLGVVNQKVDFALLLEVFKARPEWSAVLVGPVKEHDVSDPVAYRLFRGLPNAHFRPAVPFDQVPRTMRAFDMGMMPYDLSSWARWSESPLKLYQYWACGLAAISAPLPSFEGEPGVLSLGRTPEQWIREIGLELEQDGSSRREARRAKAASSSWKARARKVREAVQCVL